MADWCARERSAAEGHLSVCLSRWPLGGGGGEIPLVGPWGVNFQPVINKRMVHLEQSNTFSMCCETRKVERCCSQRPGPDPPSGPAGPAPPFLQTLGLASCSLPSSLPHHRCSFLGWVVLGTAKPPPRTHRWLPPSCPDSKDPRWRAHAWGQQHRGWGWRLKALPRRESLRS